MQSIRETKRAEDMFVVVDLRLLTIVEVTLIPIRTY